MIISAPPVIDMFFMNMIFWIIACCGSARPQNRCMINVTGTRNRSNRNAPNRARYPSNTLTPPRSPINPASGTAMVASGTPCAAACAIAALEKCENTLVMKIRAYNARPIGTIARMAIAGATVMPRGIIVSQAHMTFETLEDVIRAGLDVVAVIVQDEYTHDVIVRRAADYLVFDTT